MKITIFFIYIFEVPHFRCFKLINLYFFTSCIFNLRRNYIGSNLVTGARFAQMEIKVCLCKILSKFKIMKTPGMTEKIVFDPKSLIILIPKDEIKMKILPR